ncbi:tRNA (adenine(22)-N(1))-methyltransferase [Catenisphaera adipataccumulans]|jgi:tRNA (adenine22-N1)-methyltransferase|uniref:tRNA (Adenine22-N1)-methyltransferase n=1 Tax=Catenisphaera adipataccumulans TaxID=700500 RepID=A0A7W8CZH5_9FIRM|nr:class I SAM-dependent methyltransferase [Catenisphaera adipataccumulans]MBB5183197.1 tRNA (adenine22-N1)-methyltransferase [Catenisphaera adipataccumulans]
MISRRLRKIVDWIDGSVLADIGCDHAYVAIAAVQEHRVNKAYACDIAPGPLQRAAENIRAQNLDGQIECRLQTGIEGLPEAVDIIVIAGMGGRTIQDILSKGQIREQTFLISPHNHAADLRMYLQAHGLHILREQLITEGNHAYPILEVKKKDTIQPMTAFEIEYGKNVCNREEFQTYLDRLEQKYKTLLKQVPPEKNGELVQKLECLKKRDTL